jgi:hypothetical protein
MLRRSKRRKIVGKKQKVNTKKKNKISSQLNFALIVKLQRFFLDKYVMNSRVLSSLARSSFNIQNNSFIHSS